MTNTQNLYGFRLIAEDGSESKWVFINHLNSLLDINIRLKNGARYHFAEYSGAEFIETWAAGHHFKLQRCQYVFDCEKMAFKLLTIEEN